MSVPRLFATAVLAVVGAFFVIAPVSAGSSDNVENWAWSPNAGWISMNCTNVGTCATNGYGVHLATSPGFNDRADISGWAWSDVVGWICFGTTCSGTTPEGGSSYAQFRASLAGGTKSDQFLGWARVTALGDAGWIALNCENLGGCATSSFHVGLDHATGDFSPAAPEGRWAWNGNDDGTGIGWIDMSRVHTDWAFAQLGQVVRPQGIFEPVTGGISGTNLHTFAVTLSGIHAAPGDLVQCDITLPDGGTLVLARPVPGPVALRGTDFEVSHTVQVIDVIDDTTPWIIRACRLLGAPDAGVCTTDTDCSVGRRCDTALNRCRAIADSTARPRPIFTHSNQWTGLGAMEDQYRAIKCFAGFPGEYFNNPSFCDFTGDATFSMLMRRGVPVSCFGTDAFGQEFVDCSNPYCQGISYLCQSHVPTQCVLGAADDGIDDCGMPGYAIGSGALCCSDQPVSVGSSLYHVANGLECSYEDPDDGYFDCDCTASAFGTRADCFAPGAQSGGLCCDADDVVRRL